MLYDVEVIDNLFSKKEKDIWLPGRIWILLRYVIVKTANALWVLNLKIIVNYC